MLEDQEQNEIERKFQEIESADSKKPTKLSALMVKEFPKISWLVEKLVPVASIVALSGSPASYKTWLMFYIATKVAQGESLFNQFKTDQTGVLIIDEENGERLLQDRFKKLSKTFELSIYFESLSGFKLTTDEVNRIISQCQENKIKLIIFDSLVRIHAGDENSSGDMSRVFELLKQFNKHDITVMFTHHHRKQQGFGRSNPSQDMRGSSDILASVDCHIAVDRKFEDETIELRQTKLRQGEETKPFKLTIVSSDDDFSFEFGGEIDEVRNKVTEFRIAIKSLLEQVTQPLNKTSIFKTLKANGVAGGNSAFKLALGGMITDGEVYTRPGKGNAIFCSLQPFQEPQQELTDASTYHDTS